MARKFLKFLVVFTAAFVVTSAEEYNYEECFATDRGREYRGTIAVTMDNIPCQRWDTDFAPHDITTYGHGSFPDDTRTDAANYCRNPDNQAGGPWCYTTDPDIRWQTCKVPRCYGRVSEVTPKVISDAGNVRVTIRGKGFADSQFNFGAESHKGNKVWFVDDIQQYECEIFPDGSNEEMIQCYTPNTMEAGTYYVKVAVNGVPTPNAGLCNNNPKSWSCSLYTNVHYHPYIESVFPSAAPKDSVITVYGRFFTDKYGSNLAEATNGKTEGILRAYVQGKPCELKDGDDFYGISLWNEWANNGYLRCKVSALPVPSNVKVSVIIDAPYGKTLPLPGSYIVSATGKPFMFQTYAEVTGISPTEGSTAGGQLLTITGTGFDDTTSPDVKVGDDECEVVSVTDTEIMCRTPAEHSSVDDSYVGGRGLKNFLFTDDKKNFDDLDDLTARTDHTDMFWSDGAYWCENATQGIHDKCSVPPSSLYNVRTIGYLTPKITGDYRFYIKCDDAAKLYLSTSARVADKVVVVECPATTYTYIESENDTSLVAGESYYMEYLSKEDYGAANTYVAAKLIGFTSQTTAIEGKIQPENHKVVISSTVSKEEFNVTFNNMATQTAVEGVQVVSMTYTGSAEGSWQIGMLGVYSDLLDADTDALKLKRAIMDLASMPSSAKLNVETADVANGRTYTVTFQEGDWPALQTKQDGDYTTSVSVTTNGKSSLKSWRLQLDHGGSALLSDTITSLPPTDEQMEEALESLFQARCPPSIGDGAPGGVYYEGYEDDKYRSDSEPFCGKRFARNPGIIFNENPGKNLKATPYICFAHRGKLFNYVRVLVQMPTRSAHYYPGYDFGPGSETMWNYTCMNVLEMIEIYNPGQSFYNMLHFELYRPSHKDVYVDEVVLCSQPTTERVELLLTDRIIRATVREQSVEVTHTEVDATTHRFSVVFTPQDCENNFNLLSFSGAPVLSSSASAKTFGDNGVEWTAGSTVVVERSVRASPPVTGTWRLTHDSNVVTVAADIDVEALTNLIELDFQLPNVKVEKDGSCYGYTYNMKVVDFTSLSPDIQAEDIDLAGDSPVLTKMRVDAFTFFDPIPGDMLATSEESAQVRVTVNDISSKCTGDCGYSWSAGMTPTITGVSPASGGNGAVLTITGTGFATDNTVMIGKAECTQTASSETEITCTLGKGEIGTFDVKVTAESKGLASGSQSFEYNSGSVDSVDPSTGSLAGGTLVTVSGNGFDETAAVDIDGNACEVVEVSSTEISCRTPASTQTSAVDINVAVNSAAQTLTLSAAYTYADGVTPKVTSFSPSTAAASGGETLTINGQGFQGYGSLTVQLKDSSDVMVDLALLEDSTDGSVIEATLPPLAPGNYEVIVHSDGRGLASFSGSTTLTVTFRVDAISADGGSFEGGTRLLVVGEGFGNNGSDVSVKVGSTECEIDSITDTGITCLTGRGSQTVVVDNSGTHVDFGLGYAWNTPVITINTGDIVRFRWTSPQFVDSVLFKVMQAPDQISDSDGTGFNSGEGSPNGQFEHQFNDVGTFYYTTGYIGQKENIEMRGQVTVEARNAFVADVTVTRGGQTAAMNSGSGVTATESVSCAGTTAAISGCSESTAVSPTEFQFAYLNCRTPSVTQQDVIQGNIDTDITFTGNGFSTTSCENEITIGEYTCAISSQSTTELVCNMDVSEEPDVGVVLPVKVKVNNLGNAQMEYENQTFALIPSITGISPTSGSTAGGTNVTITGAGFVGAKTVEIGLYPCAIESESYTSIICSTSAAGITTTGELKVISTNSYGAAVPAECKLSDCDFEYSAASTPSLTSLTFPTDAITNASTSIRMSGTALGTDTSAVSVWVGEVEGTVDLVSDTELTFTVPALPAGTHDTTIYVDGLGKGVGPQVTAGLVASAISPTSGSVYGGQVVTVDGVGFTPETVVTLNDVDCNVTSVSTTQILCVSGASEAAADAQVKVNVKVSGVSNAKDLDFSYDDAITPKITAVSPGNGVSGDTLTITGTSFSSTDSSVDIGGVACAVTTASATEIVCTVGSRRPGVVNVVVSVDGVGLSNGDTEFTYNLEASGLSSVTGSFGGGQEVTLTGSGFTEDAVVLLCDVECDVDQSGITTTTLTFVTPSMEDSYGSGTKECDLKVDIGTKESILASAYTYMASQTAVITQVSPARGGTKGGTTVTITGEKFSLTGNAVTIYDTPCVISSESETEIVCVTGEPNGTRKANVVVETVNNGVSLLENSDFWYVDVWSSVYTWGGNAPPTKGDLVVIPQDQILLLDEDTEVLAMVLIQGGELLFDDTDLTLNAENILIVNGGKLTVGTEEKPFEHQATIMMHGQLRAPELPIYGAKCLAVREGELNLHGKFIRMTWTRLAATANAGDNQIELEHGQSDWPVGGIIAIATTGDHHSQKETEVKEILSISADGRTITLNETLEYTHLGVTAEMATGYTLEMRAEVALLSRNVRVVGSRDVQYEKEIEACPDGFDPGEFATQTCFQGRFGDEIGNDQFGAQIMLHAPRKNENLARAKLSYIEVNYAGQAFRLGRYPIHFHLNGDMNGSYVRGLAIHETFNRAVNVHGSHNILIEHTVIYNVMGGAFFLEDGIETNNRYEYNLALFVKASSSLLNDDITPAAFWATNPDNHYKHNAVAGGTHFGWWYRLLEHPEGPSATDTVCPRHVPLGDSYNNSVHSNGWFGLWTFQDYYPMVGGGCDATEPEPAVFEKFIVWNCEKGLEFVNGGALQFKDCLLANNHLSGLEGKRTMKLGSEVPYTDRGPLIRDSVIAAYVPDYENQASSKLAIVLPWSEGFSIKNTVFINYDSNTSVVFGMTSIQGTCSVLCGAYNYYVSQLQFVNGQDHLVKFRWNYDGVFRDLDGSLSGVAGGNVLTWTDTLDPDKCVKDDRFSQGAAQGAVCDETTQFARLSFNHPNMQSMLFKNVIMTNKFGYQVVPYADKRMTHKEGWTAVVEIGQNYEMAWENIEHITNISYDAGFYDMSGGSVIITHKVDAEPDRVNILGTPRELSEGSENPLNYKQNVHGDFIYDKNNKKISYMVSDITSRKKREADRKFVVQNVKPSAYKCYWPDCQPPPDPTKEPPADERPDVFDVWSDGSIWPTGSKPELGALEVVVPFGRWIFVNETLIQIKKLYIDGVMDVDNTESANLVLEVDFMIIRGGRFIAGFDGGDIFKGNLEIILNGDVYSESEKVNGGPPVGVKAIGVFGGLDLHGFEVKPVITHLAATVEKGDSVITVDADVEASGWNVSDKIMITATTYDAHQTEIRTISAISEGTITLDTPLEFGHLGEVITDDSGDVHYLAAEVALLTRNIVIRSGGDIEAARKAGLGGRVLVSSANFIDSNGIDKARFGWARISYTQFINMGQYGYTEAFDPRYAIAYVGTGEHSNIRPCFLKGNSFEDGFSPAIGIFGADGHDVISNVMYKVVGGGMVVDGRDHYVKGNMVALNLWPGSYEGRRELKNVAYESSFELTKARESKFYDNIAAGSERSGFSLAGELCVDVDPELLGWKGNKVHSSMFGVMIWKEDTLPEECIRISGFTAWKNYDFGIFIETSVIRIEFEDNDLIENGLGLWTHTFGHGSLSHFRKEKSISFKRGYVAGATPFFDCEKDVKPSTVSFELSSLARSWRSPSGGNMGLSMPNADGGSNGLPTHPFRGRMSYPTLDAKMDIDGTRFAHFGSRSCDGKEVMDFIISSNIAADDVNHPVNVQNVVVEDTVDFDNIAFFHSPNVGKVNPSDCVDMECDGHKKSLIHDLDGTLLGQSGGTVLDDAEVNWDGDARFGIGDYRIPKVMLTFPNSTTFDPPKKHGIYRDNTCTYIDSWRAYHCTGPKYRMLVIESMDKDTEVRRLSPIGLKARTEDGGYMDLLNGPQDHGWCAGYTCQKRISTFWAVVADGVTFDLYLTGTNPQHTRFFMLQAEEDERVRLAVYYFSPQRLDVFKDDIYIYPTNAEITGDGNYNLKPSTQTPSEYLPDIDAAAGQNYFDREWQLQYLILKGTAVVDVIIKEVVLVSLTLPPMTIDDFFGEKVVENLAAFLGIPPEKIRIVDVISEATNRRKRDVSGTTIQFEIADAPVSGTNITNVNDGELDRSKLLNLTRKVVDSVQLGTLGESLNLTILGIDVQEPLPIPENSTDSSWALLTNGSDVLAAIQIPSEMKYTTELVADREQQPFPTQPEFSMYDANMELVEVLGSRGDPWKIRAVLDTNAATYPTATLIGETTCGFVDGVCTFETLGISHQGSGYVIKFEVFDPSEASFAATSASITVKEAALSSGFTSVPDKDMPVMVNDTFTAVVDIRDLSSQMVVEDIGWNNDVWTATISIYSPEISPDTQLLGTLEKSFDVTSGLATFDDLQITTRGRYSLKADVKSATKTLTSGRSAVFEVKENVTMQDEEVSYKFSLRFNADYSMYAEDQEDIVEASVYNFLLSIDDSARYHDFSISEGSILIDFWASGETDSLLAIINTVEGSIVNGTSLNLPGVVLELDKYMKLDDTVYGGLDGTEEIDDVIETTTLNEAKLNQTTIIIAVVISATLVLVAALILIVVVSKKKSAKTYHSDTEMRAGVSGTTPPPENSAAPASKGEALSSTKSA